MRAQVGYDGSGRRYVEFTDERGKPLTAAQALPFKTDAVPEHHRWTLNGWLVTVPSFGAERSETLERESPVPTRVYPCMTAQQEPDVQYGLVALGRDSALPAAIFTFGSGMPLTHAALMLTRTLALAHMAAEGWEHTDTRSAPGGVHLFFRRKQS